jgi:hypothetical protein
MDKLDFERIREQWREKRITSFDAIELLLRAAESYAVGNNVLLATLFDIQDIVTEMRGENGKIFLKQGVTEVELRDEYKPKPPPEDTAGTI